MTRGTCREARTQGASICSHIGATEDAASWCVTPVRRPDPSPGQAPKLGAGVAHLIVIAYENEARAKDALAEVFQLVREGVIDVESASVVRRREDGALQLAETGDVSDRLATFGGAFGGLVLGVAVAAPLIGTALGAAAGLAAAKRTDLGIADDFQREIGEKLAPGRAAVVLLGETKDREAARREAGRLGGELLATDLAPDAEEQLRRILEDAR
jgi:uncharacterized membrane protein